MCFEEITILEKHQERESALKFANNKSFCAKVWFKRELCKKYLKYTSIMVLSI